MRLDWLRRRLRRLLEAINPAAGLPRPSPEEVMAALRMAAMADRRDAGGDWNGWCAQRAGLEVAGWTVCRYPVRMGPGGAAFAWMIGITRDGFGVHQMPRPCFDAGEGEPSERVVSFVTHLHTGFQFGAFLDRTEAIEAALIASRCVAWERGAGSFAPVLAGYERAGFAYSRQLHAHDEDGRPIPLWTRAEPRPAVLS